MAINFDLLFSKWNELSDINEGIAKTWDDRLAPFASKTNIEQLGKEASGNSLLQSPRFQMGKKSFATAIFLKNRATTQIKIPCIK